MSLEKQLHLGLTELFETFSDDMLAFLVLFDLFSFCYVFNWRDHELVQKLLESQLFAIVE